MRKLLSLLVCVLVGATALMAQNRTITGTVISNEDGEPIIGATVRIAGTDKGTITDGKGQFSLSVPADAKTLTFSYIGMETVEASIHAKMNIALRSSEQVLDDVMVVAYGTAKKSAFTGAAAVVNTEDLSKHITTNVTNSLVGTVPGLQIRGGSGAPGAGSGAISIRGIASLYAGTDPLVIVDGAPYSASLSNIPQGDIESVTVLKDAASAALYGARGAAGVILITTKKGKTQEAVINVDVKWGANTRAIQDYDVISDPGQYYEAYYSQLYNNYFYGQGMTQAAANALANERMFKGDNTNLGYNVYTVPEGQLLIGTDGKLNPNATLGRKYTAVNGIDYWLQPDDWTDAAYSSALRQEYNVSISAGDTKSSFYVSAGYLNEDGIIEYSGYERFSSRVKADYQAKKWLRVGANVGYTRSHTKSNPNLDGSQLGSTNLMYYTSMIAPIYPIYVRTIDENGNIAIRTDENGNEQYDYGVAAGNYYGLGRAFLQTGNPLGSNRYNVVGTVGNQINGTFTVDIDLTSWLKFNSTNNANFGQTSYSDYENPFYGPKATVNGDITKYQSNTLRTNYTQTLNFHKLFGKHDAAVLLGHEYYKTRTRYLDAAANGGFSPDIKEINAFANRYDSHSYQTRYNVEGWFGQAQYNYDETYYLTASYRRDATSYFNKDNRWGDFWSVGGAWLINKESFFNVDWVDQLKLKASIGQQGNDAIGSFGYTDLYTLSKASETSMTPTFYRLGNPDISWETTTNFNAGVEFSLWKGRLVGDVDVFNKKTDDLLFWLSVPESTGSRGYYGNMGDLKNVGFEVTLSGDIIRKRNLRWNVAANLTHYKAEITKLPDSKKGDNGGFAESDNIMLWYEEGGSPYTPFLFEYAGVSETGEALYWADPNVVQSNGAPDVSRPAVDHAYTTTNISEANRYKQKSMLPKVFGGFQTTIEAYGFDASVAFDYQIGGKIYDRRYATLMTPTEDQANGYNFHKDVLKSWTPNNTSSDIPRFQYGDKYTAYSSSRFLTNASYLNFQSFTLGYTLPKKLTTRFGISKLRVYAAGENLCFWSAREGLDPRYAYDGNESISQYSPVRNVSGGLQVTF